MKIALAVFLVASIGLLARGEVASVASVASYYPTTPGAMPPSPRSRSVISRCATCHQMDPLFSHPVDVVPTMRVPADLPLENGRITCLTCHADGSGEAHVRSMESHDGMLRATAPNGSLCVRCHDAGSSGRKMHALALNRAHLNTRSGRKTGLSLSSSGMPDAETMTCVGCHDGTVARDTSGGLESRGMNFGRSFATNTADHPVGVVYNASPASRGGQMDMPLRAPQSLDRRVRLLDGQVGCGSCHSPYSKEKSLLVMSNYRSALCLSCHKG